MAAPSDPLLSIVVPALDEATGIVATLDRLAPLRARGAEVLVVDGGSSDATPEIARSRCDRVLVSERGRARQMNAGAALARGAVLLFLHADTVLPAHADALIARALADPRREWGRFDVAIDGRSRWLRVIAWMMNRRSRWTGIATGDQAVFVRASTFAVAGRYPEIDLMEDIALTRALRRRSAPACLRERVVTSGRRWERNGVWSTILLMWRLRLLYFLGVSPARLARAYRSR